MIDIDGSGIFNGTLWICPGTERGTEVGTLSGCKLTGTLDLSEPQIKLICKNEIQHFLILKFKNIFNTYHCYRRRHVSGSDNCGFRHNDRSHRNSARQARRTHNTHRQMIRPTGRRVCHSFRFIRFRQNFSRRRAGSSVRRLWQSAAVRSGEWAATRRTGGFNGRFVDGVLDGDPRLDADVARLLGDSDPLLGVRSIRVRRRSSTHLIN